MTRLNVESSISGMPRGTFHSQVQTEGRVRGVTVTRYATMGSVRRYGVERAFTLGSFRDDSRTLQARAKHARMRA